MDSLGLLMNYNLRVSNLILSSDKILAWAQKGCTLRYLILPRKRKSVLFIILAISKRMNYNFPDESKLVVADDYNNFGNISIGLVLETYTDEIRLGDCRHSKTKKYMISPGECTEDDRMSETYQKYRILTEHGTVLDLPVDEKYSLDDLDIRAPEVFDFGDEGLNMMLSYMKDILKHEVYFDSRLKELENVYMECLKKESMILK